MAELAELVNRLKSFRDKLPEVLPEIATLVSLSGKALAERTIKDKGFGKLYSNNDIPAFFLKGKEINARGRSYLDQASKDDKGVSWGDFRQAQGLQNKFVDLTYSGKMWAGMFPGEVQVNLFTYIAPLGNNTTEGQKKMNWNRERYGDFIGQVLTGDNLEALKRVGYEELVKVMDRNFSDFKI